MGEPTDRCELEKPPSSFKSAVWKHFGFPVKYENGIKTVSKDETVCRHCNTRIRYTSRTTNMSTHMRRHHAKLTTHIDEFEIETKSETKCSDVKSKPTGQLRLQDAFKSKLSPQSVRAKAMTNSVAVFIATDMRPFSVVENAGFKNMLRTFEPRYELPSKTHFTNSVIPDIYRQTKLDVLQGIERAVSVALTTDGWTSRATESYVTITAHYVTEDWKLENPVLQTRPLHESHTGANLANVLHTAVVEWRLDKFEKLAISTDNASNIVSAVRQTDFSPHIRCFAHTINLASQKAMSVPQMSRILGRVRRVVSFFHRSSHAASVLKTKQILLELPVHKLIQDVSTRWNSSYEMMDRYLEQQAAIFATLTTKDIRKNADSLVTLSDDDVTGVEDATRVMKSLKTITTMLCNEKAPTVSMIKPLKQLILKSMVERDSDSTLIKAIKSAIVKDMKDRYMDPDIDMFLQEATALDPRFRSLPYSNDDERLEVYSSLNRLALQAATQAQETPVTVKKEPETGVPRPPLPDLPDLPDPAVGTATSDVDSPESEADTQGEMVEPSVKKLKSEFSELSQKSAMEEIFGDVFITSVQKGKPLASQIEEEISKYKMEPCIPLTENPLDWWKAN